MSEWEIVTRHHNLQYQFLITASKVCEHVIENLSSWLLQQVGTGELSLVVTLLYFQFQIFLTVAMLHDT